MKQKHDIGTFFRHVVAFRTIFFFYEQFFAITIDDNSCLNYRALHLLLNCNCDSFYNGFPFIPYEIIIWKAQGVPQ